MADCIRFVDCTVYEFPHETIQLPIYCRDKTLQTYRGVLSDFPFVYGLGWYDNGLCDCDL